MLDFISNIFKPVAKLVDEVHTSDEERMKLRNALAKMQMQMQSKSIDLMKAEASSDHFIVAAWRPFCSIILIFLVVADGYGWAKAPEQIYGLAESFLMMYTGSRGLEKVTKTFKGK